MERVVIEVVSGNGKANASAGDVAHVAAQIPRADSLPKGTRVVVFAGKARGWLGKMLTRDAASMSAIGSALLARGYVNVGAGDEKGRACAWGDA